MKVKQTDIQILQGDITELEVDAIVNAANNTFVMGGGVAAAIRKKGGSVIEQEAVAQGPVAVGKSVVTQAGSLKARHVIHAVTMAMDFQTDQEKVRASCASALKCAEELNLSSIAFPALGCGTGGFPLNGAARIMTQEVLKLLRGRQTCLKTVIFCLYEQKTFEEFNRIVTGYLGHYLNKLGPGPYATVDILIEYQKGLVIIERHNPPYGFALPGGFLDYGESLEEAAAREAKEETNLDLENLRQFHTYSDPSRDPRFHTVTTVFTARGKGEARSGDDAKALHVVPLDKVFDYTYAFDHKEIIEEYLRGKGGKG